MEAKRVTLNQNMGELERTNHPATGIHAVRHMIYLTDADIASNLTPFTVIPVSYFLFREKIPRFFLIGAVITVMGVFILLGGKINPGKSNYLGDFLAFCASFFYASFILISYRLRDRYESSVIMFVSGFGSVLVLGITSLLVIGHNLLAHCQGKISVNLSAIVCLCQPVIASLYSYFIFSETLSTKEVLGITGVMAGVYLVKAQYTNHQSCEA